VIADPKSEVDFQICPLKFACDIGEAEMIFPPKGPLQAGRLNDALIFYLFEDTS
jgi:hypothetical protein